MSDYVNLKFWAKKKNASINLNRPQHLRFLAFCSLDNNFQSISILPISLHNNNWL